MKIFRELELLDSEAERQQVYRSASSQLRRRPQFWVFLVVAPIAIAVPLGLALVGLSRIYPVLRQLSGALVGGIIGGTFGVTVQFFFRKPLQRLIRVELVKRGIPICVGCGYDLRGQESPRCPECGLAFEVAVLGAQTPSAGAMRDDNAASGGLESGIKGRPEQDSSK